MFSKGFKKEAYHPLVVGRLRESDQQTMAQRLKPLRVTLDGLQGSAEPLVALPLKVPPEVLQQLTTAAAGMNCKRSVLARALLAEALQRHGLGG